MTNITRARITWVPPERGGRKTIPQGPRYSAPARFEDLKDKWPEIAWSIAVKLPEPNTSSSIIYGTYQVFVNK